MYLDIFSGMISILLFIVFGIILGGVIAEKSCSKCSTQSNIAYHNEYTKNSLNGKTIKSIKIIIEHE